MEGRLRVAALGMDREASGPSSAWTPLPGLPGRGAAVGAVPALVRMPSLLPTGNLTQAST